MKKKIQKNSLFMIIVDIQKKSEFTYSLANLQV